MRRLRIFISSPGDVQKERQVVRSIVDRLAGQFADVVELDPYFWEYEPMRVTADFQTQIEPPSDFDIVVCILWSRLGTPLRAPDGQVYQSGTEYEVNTAIASYHQRGIPDVLVYHSQSPAQIRRSPKDARERAYRQLEAVDAFLEKLALDPQTGTVKGAIIRYANLAEFEERVEAHLRKLIVDRVGEPPPVDEARRTMPVWEGNPFRGLELFDFEHASIFFGRTKAIGDIIDMLRRQTNTLEEQAALSPRSDLRAPEPDAAVREAPPRPAIFVLISAMSGAGKSSLVRAGVLPLLTRPGVVEGIGLWRRAIMLPSTSSGDLFDSLALSLIAPEALPELTSSGKDAQQLATMLRRSPAGIDLLISQSLAHAADLLRIEEDRQLERMIDNHREAGRIEDAERCVEARRQLKPRAARLALLVDQLEEIFTLPRFRNAPEAAADFVSALAALARSGHVFVIATLRSDFFGRCAELPELMELKAGDGAYDLPLPTSQEIGQIIRQPAIAAGLQYETIGKPDEEIALDERLRDDAIGHPEALPLLEYCLSGLYELRRGNLLTHDAYERLGGVEAALAKRAEDVFQGLSSVSQDSFDPAMRRLTTASREKEGIAYARSWSDYQQLCELPGAKAFIDAFVGPQARLFIAGQDLAGRAVVTLTHEALLRAWPRLSRWLTANGEMLQVKAAVAGSAKQWVESNKDVGYLLPRGLQLEKAKSAASDGYLEKVEADFVQASIAAERKIVVRQRMAIAALFGIVTTVLGAGAQYTWQRYDQGRLSVESNEPTAKLLIDEVELGLPVANFSVRSGRHALRAFADGFIDRTETVDIKRGEAMPLQAYLWLEKGLDWTYSSPAIQGGLAVLPDPSGGPSLIAHNELTQIIFLSAADGKLVKTIPTPTGNWRTFKTIDLGGDAGAVLVTGLDQEQSGPELVVVRATAPAQVLWTWNGPQTGYAAPQSLAIEPLPRPSGSADLLVAGRDGRVYVLDGKSGKELQTITISDQPLAISPTLFAWQDAKDTIITALIRPGDPSHYSTSPLNMIAISLRLSDGGILWRRELGSQWNPAVLPLVIDNHPQVFLYNDKNWQLLDAENGATHGMFALPAPLIGGPALADMTGNGKPNLVFEFADASQPMLAVDWVTGATVWRGPSGLNSSTQPRNGSNVLQTSSGALLIVTADSLAAVDAHSGKITWSIAGVPRGVLIGDWDGDGSAEILVTISGVGLLCLDGSGQVRWTLRFSDDVEPWSLITPQDGGSRDILIHRHAGLIGLVHGPSILWERKANAAIQATPLVAPDAQGHPSVIEVAPWGNDVSLRAFDGAYGKILWSTKDNLSPNRGGTLADIDGTGQAEVVTVSLPTQRRNQLIIYRPTDGTAIRAKETTVNSWLSCTPAVADYRGNGKSDVAFSTWDDRSIVMIDGRSGEILWRYDTGSPNMSGVASADLDGDGLPDVVAATPGGYVYGLRGKDGALLWKTPIPGGAWSVPTVATLDPNAPPYVLVTSFTGGLYVLDSHTGDVAWTKAASGVLNPSNAAIGNLKVGGHAIVVRESGRTVIVAPAGAAGVMAIDWQTRSELWRSPAGIPVVNSPVAVELTGQRGPGIVVAAATGDVWTFTLAGGKPLWHRQFALKTVEADPVVTDLDGDGIPDILLAGYDFELHAISGLGTGIQKPLGDVSSPSPR
jgi:hypothetical protein